MRTTYDEGKRFAEALTATYRRTRRANTGIARIFNTYGSRMKFHDGRAVPTLIISLARALLGWSPTVDLKDGLERTIGWFAQELGSTLTQPGQ
ncbi:MAG: NAD-dependent epimerase/dehydratase family protein [Pseudonocardiaceae bacterium]